MVNEFVGICLGVASLYNSCHDINNQAYSRQTLHAVFLYRLVMSLNIVKATINDSRNIMELIKSCILNMESVGIYQWNEYYPTLDIIMSDVESGSLYVLKEGNDIWGIIVINEDQSPEYRNLSWGDEGKVLVVHRLAVQPNKQRTGIAKKLMDFAEIYAKEKEFTSIRLDTYSGNPIAMTLYEQRGYIRVGQVYFPMRELPFNCYEKVL